MSVVIHRPTGFAESPVLDFSRCRVLVLDPFIGTRRIVMDLLVRDMKVGSVEACGSVADALLRLSKGDFNVLFTDWSGEVDAPRLMTFLRGPESPNRFLPIVVMTGYNSAECVKRARDAGMSEFMLKPFSAMVVQSRLKGVVQATRFYVESDDYFGPDRRRRRDAWEAPERRCHSNCRYADRRRKAEPIRGPERRQGRAGYRPCERRGGGR